MTKRLMRGFLFPFLIYGFVILAIMQLNNHVHAESFVHQIDGLSVLSLDYGANTFKVGENDVQIVRGDFNSEAAGQGDVYLILVKEKPDDSHWKVVRYFPGGAENIMTITAPHTYEDSIVSVRFMMPKKEFPGQHLSSLYLLKAERDYMPNPSGLPDGYEHETLATFTLYKLKRDDDFGIFYLKQVAEHKAKKKYCNVDWAMKQELNVTLPDNDPDQYVCIEQQ